MNTWSRQSSSSYSDAESRLDAVIQGTATAISVIAAIWLVITCRQANTLPGLMIYSVCLIAMFATSLAYAHLSSGRSKEIWRRLDHAMIFALIAGTYTPLVMYRLPVPQSSWILVLVWALAILGIAGKFVFPRRFEYIGMALSVGIGLMGVFFIHELLLAMTPVAFGLLIVGVAFYLLGAIVLQLHRLRFHNALWHLLVLAAAGSHFVAIAMEFAWQLSAGMS